MCLLRHVVGVILCYTETCCRCGPVCCTETCCRCGGVVLCVY